MRRIARGIATSLVGALVISFLGVVSPSVASATATCISPLGQDENGNDIVAICYEIGESIHGQPKVTIQVDYVDGTGVRVIATPDGRVVDWVNVCPNVPSVLDVCVP